MQRSTVSKADATALFSATVFCLFWFDLSVYFENETRLLVPINRLF